MSGYNTGFTFNSGATAPSLTATEVGFGSGANTLSGAATLTYNSTTGVLTSSLGDALIHGATVGLGGGGLTSNIALGVNALVSNTTATNNVAVGNLALRLATTGGSNTAVGANALQSNVSGTNNVAVGTSALTSSTTSGNTAVGTQAAQNTTTGASIVAIGNGALRSNTTGTANTAVGASALSTNSTGTNSVAVGTSALASFAGSGSTAVGAFAGQSATGVSNTLIGYFTGNSLTTGASNTFVGSSAGSQVTTGASNTILGQYNGLIAPISQTGSRYVVLADGTGQIDAYWDSTRTMFLQGAINTSGTAGTAGQVLTSNGAGVAPTWSAASGGGLTLATSIVNSTFYPTFSSVSSGAVSTEYTSAFLLYNASTNVFTSGSFSATSPSLGYVQSTGFAGTIGFQAQNSNTLTGSNTAINLFNSSAQGAVLRVNSSGFTSSATNFFNVNNGVALFSTINSNPVSIGSQSAGVLNLTYLSGGAAHTIDNSGAILLGSVVGTPGSAGTSGQVLTSNGASAPPSWTTVSGGGLTLATTTTSASYYITLSSTATGAVSTEYTTPKINFNPGTGTLYTQYIALTGTGIGLSLSGPNTGAANTISTANSDNTAGSAANFTASVTGGATATVQANSSAFNASPTTFLQVNSMAYLSGTSAVTVFGPSGVNLGYGAAGATRAHTINATGALLLASTPTVAGNAGTLGQVLTSAGSGAPPTWSTISGTATLAVNQVGYGSGTNTLTGNAGFTYSSSTGKLTAGGDASFNLVTVGAGAGSLATNTALGNTVMVSNTTGARNTAIGNNVLKVNTTASDNVGVGYNVLSSNTTTGSNNVAVGSTAMAGTNPGNSNVAIGYGALSVGTGSGNTMVGNSAGASISSGANNTILGSYSGALAPISTTGSNWIVLSDGASNIPVYWNGTTKAMYVNASAGTAGQVLTSAGSGATPTWSTPASGGVSSFSGGITGLTPNTATTGAITLAGLLGTGYGGTNNSTIGGAGTVVFSNGTQHAFTALGTSGQVLTSAGTGTPTWTTLTNSLTLAAGSASATNYLTFSTAATGTVTTEYTNTNLTYNPSTFVFTSAGGDAYFNSVRIGRGTGNVSTNTVVGTGTALNSITTGATNTAIGNNAGSILSSGSSNTLIGSGAGSALTTGGSNVVIGGYTASAAPISATGSNYVVLSDGAGNVPVYWVGTGNKTQTNNGAIVTPTHQVNTNPNTAPVNGIYGWNAANATQAIAYVDTSYNSVHGDYTQTGTDTWIQSGRDVYFAPNGANSTTSNPAVSAKLTSSGQFLIGTVAASPITGYASPKLGVVATAQDGLTVLTAAGNNTINVAKTAPNTNGTGLTTGQTFISLIGNGTSSATTYGSATVNGTGALWNTSSDARLKTNVVTIANGIESVKALNPVNFDWIDSDAKGQGFIAQEAKEVVPLAVTYLEEQDVYQMDYSKVVPVLTAAIKEQQAIIEALTARLDKAGL